MSSFAVILNYNDADTTLSLVNEVKDYDVFNKIVVVDNNSSDNSFSMLKESINHEKVFVVKSEKNGGYGYGNNYGVRYAMNNFDETFDSVFIINPDIHVTNKTCQNLVDFLATNPDVSLISPTQLNPDLSEVSIQNWSLETKRKVLKTMTYIQKKFFYKEKKELIYYDTDKNYQIVDCVSGPFLCFRLQSFVDLGMYDEQFFLYYEENLIGHQLHQRGLKTILARNETYIHDHSVSIKKSITSELNRRMIVYRSRSLYFHNYLNPSFGERIQFAILNRLSIMELYVFAKRFNRAGDL